QRGYLTWSSLPEEHTMLRDMCRSFADNELAPNAGEWDKNHTFPKEQQVAQLGELGLMGVAISEENGGTGLDYLVRCYAFVQETSQG
ncbi:unnamed protein product, partial [Hapterophycus canaliculatus]